jgi:glycosyltransferase involved in cell wall biosynthesis
VIGNEVPPLVARFHGRRTIERFLKRLYDVAKEEDPEALVTYGNYPSTEFLQLDFVDFYMLNLYLLEQRTFAAYLDRMLIQTKGKPLLLGEVGEDSFHKSEERQAEVLDWTIPHALEKGACGVCVFSWTDDWVVGGHRVEDWTFGLVDAARKPKKAYDVVRRRFGESPFDWRETWPRVSVVVCNYNGASTLDETLSSLENLCYPDYEIVYVDDGSTDESLAIAERHRRRVRIIAQKNQGLSVARNVGAEAATGEIVAYIDSDAHADPDWLRHLVTSMESGNYAAAGGPNLTPASDGLTAQFIAFCPGNPTYVLKDNVRAEHIAGVNMAFRRDILLHLGGFDPVHTRAGDDVDICWRIEDARFSLAFSPAAIVWHHRRPSIRTYLRQQFGYGEAENQLERKHPERFNLGGYIRWSGRVYAAPRRVSSVFRPFIFHGRLGLAMFQTLYQKEPSSLFEVPTMIQWYLVAVALLCFSPFSFWLLPLGLAMLSLSAWLALLAGVTIEPPVRLSRGRRFKKAWVIGCLHFIHPVVRWYGRFAARLRHGKPNWQSIRRWICVGQVLEEFPRLALKRKESKRYWGAGTGDREPILRALQRELKSSRISTTFAQDWDNFDLFLNGNLATEGRLYTAPEHYDQALRFGFKAYISLTGRCLFVLSTFLGFILSMFDARLSLVLAVPLVLLWYIMGERARLRAKVWEAVESVMTARDAKRF